LPAPPPFPFPQVCPPARGACPTCRSALVGRPVVAFTSPITAETYPAYAASNTFLSAPRLGAAPRETGARAQPVQAFLHWRKGPGAVAQARSYAFYHKENVQPTPEADLIKADWIAHNTTAFASNGEYEYFHLKQMPSAQSGMMIGPWPPGVPGLHEARPPVGVHVAAQAPRSTETSAFPVVPPAVPGKRAPPTSGDAPAHASSRTVPQAPAGPVIAPSQVWPMRARSRRVSCYWTPNEPVHVPPPIKVASWQEGDGPDVHDSNLPQYASVEADSADAERAEAEADVDKQQTQAHDEEREKTAAGRAFHERAMRRAVAAYAARQMRPPPIAPPAYGPPYPAAQPPPAIAHPALPTSRPTPTPLYPSAHSVTDRTSLSLFARRIADSPHWQ
jgi:hypothetical protein